ncbi:MAG: hypothetical protein LBC95_03170 [Candidatus Nomurabacteria bacterium]|jgi:isopentenyldiphosphate isomerase|nr:hypothetical protein [Candidatus Nomurabacteria bacterium]
MDEEIIISPLANLYENKTHSRKKFYDEQFSPKGDGLKPPELAVHIASVLLVGIDGSIVLQKRSSGKRHNPSLIDKTLGGHIRHGDSVNYTVMVETIQELSVPSVVLDDAAELRKTLELLRSHIETIAMIYKKTTRPWQLDKIVDGQVYHINNVVHLYFGVYGGRMRPADCEASGILYYDSLKQLEEEIASNPDIFTDDLRKLCAEYHDDILEFQKMVQATVSEPDARLQNPK